MLLETDRNVDEKPGAVAAEAARAELSGKPAMSAAIAAALIAESNPRLAEAARVVEFFPAGIA